MSKIIENEQLSKDFFLMTVQYPNKARMGQFYMLRGWGSYPVLSRPVSVFDSNCETISFMYKVVGEGTALLSAMKPGDSVTLQGPLGSAFPFVTGRVAMVGGGVGIAPLYYAAKELKKAGSCTVDLYLGFSDKALLAEKYEKVADKVTVNVGGFITDEIDPTGYDAIFTCGPEIMMKVLYSKCEAVGKGEALYVSIENRMACGIGACLVCSCKTISGNKKACKDGPVLKGSEVFFA